jgi:hypothetical protein
MNDAISIISVATKERKFVMSIRFKQAHQVIFILLSCIIYFQNSFSITTLTRNDPYPVFNTLDPQEYLYTREKLALKGWELTPPNWLYERFNFSVSPFGQNANFARDADEQFTQIGDLETGRWGMLALLYGNLPQGVASLPPKLLTALNAIFPSGGNPDRSLALNDPDLIDKNHEFGFFSVPLFYRKRGVRFEFDARLYKDFGFSLQTGIVDINQTATAEFNNLTKFCCMETPPLCVDAPQDCMFMGNSGCNIPISACMVDKYLMEEITPIADQICLDLDNFHATSIEEIRFNLFWRHAYPVNLHEEEYPEFLFYPFVQVTASFSPGKERNANKAFAAPFGNNRHTAIGFNTGLNFDFFDTIEIGGELSLTYFFKHNHCLRIPNSEYQTGIFPFTAAASVQPGYNWNFNAKMSAYHFLGHLSFWFQYVFVEHDPDKTKVLDCDPAFFPDVLDDNSDWKVHLANVGFNYDLSPNYSLGFFWQAPLVQKNVYRSTTIMFSFNATY